MRTVLFLSCLFSLGLLAAEPEFPLTPDSMAQPGVAQGTLIKDSFTANEGSVFPGTEREYQIYLPAGFDKSQPAHFIVFQDGVIYKAPVVFDNLIARKDIPLLVGIFIKPGVVPAANDNALPRFNRSYEYDSITDTYSTFLIDEFLPAIEKKHGLQLSRDPNHAAISGNSSGGICAFMVAWHRPDRFRRVFTRVGTYVGIHGADQLPVLVRKFEPKPLRIFLQSGTGDNNLYCGDWWMANQMMERSLTWAGYDVNHAWGEGGHNQKHASQIFPDVLRWLWRDWQTDIEVKANPKGESKWKGYEVVEQDGWSPHLEDGERLSSLTSDNLGNVFAIDSAAGDWWKLPVQGKAEKFGSGNTSGDHGLAVSRFVLSPDGKLIGTGINNPNGLSAISANGETKAIDYSAGLNGLSLCVANDGWFYMGQGYRDKIVNSFSSNVASEKITDPLSSSSTEYLSELVLSPDQTQLFALSPEADHVKAFSISPEHHLRNEQVFFKLERAHLNNAEASGLCVDSDGRLYVATYLGIQVCDQAGRVNFIIPTPKPAHDVCFGGKDLGELFIACDDAIYKRPMKVRGVVSGQQAPIKPAAPKL